MKKILIALTMLGFTAAGAVAQTCHTAKTVKAKKVAHLTKHNTRTSTSGDTYQVCREQGGYYTCCVYKKNNTTLKSW